MKTSVYCIKSDGSELRPTILKNDLDVRRVSEGENVNIAALSDGSLLLFIGGKIKKVETGIKDRIDSLYIVNEKPLDLLIGTTPPFLYRLKDNGNSQKIEAFDNLDVRDSWYTPWGGPAAVRSVAGTKDGWIYADIHVGSVMWSSDKGINWSPVTPTLHKDVHEVATTPACNERVYANTYLSVYVSNDRGENWEHRSNVLNDRYGRGIAVNPKNPDVILCGVSNGPRGTNVHGQLYYTEDGGVNWIHIDKGFPESTRKNIDTFHIEYAGEDIAWVTDENKLYLSTNQGKNWDIHWEAPEEIVMISCSV